MNLEPEQYRAGQGCPAGIRKEGKPGRFQTTEEAEKMCFFVNYQLSWLTMEVGDLSDYYNPIQYQGQRLNLNCACGFPKVSGRLKESEVGVDLINSFTYIFMKWKTASAKVQELKIWIGILAFHDILTF